MVAQNRYHKGRIEMYNKIEGLSNNEIYRRRKTESMPILNDMKRRAEAFLRTDGGVASDKMYTAVNYMLNFWRELINYTKEGHYTIDNSAAERSIRPLTVGRLCGVQHKRPYVGNKIMLAM